MTTTISAVRAGNVSTELTVAPYPVTWHAVNSTWASWTAVNAANTTWSDVRDG